MPFQDPLQKLPRKSTALLLFAILCFGAILRMANLHNEQAWFDEIVTLRHLQAASLGEYLDLCRPRHPHHPPLYMTAQFFWSRIFGAGEYATRMLSIVAAMLSLVMIFLLTKKLYGSRAGLIATLWLAFIPFHIYYAQQIRFYAFTTLFALLSMYIFLKLLRDGRARWWISLTLVDLAIMWNQPLGGALFLAQALYLLIYHRKQIRLVGAWGLQHVLIGATLIPWILRIDNEASIRVQQWLDLPRLFGGGKTVETFFRVSAGELPYLPTNAVGESLFFLKPIFTWILVATYVLAALYVLLHIKKGDTDALDDEKKLLPPKQTFILVGSWLLVPPIALFILSYIWRPTFLERYLIYSMLPLYILMGAFISSLRPRIRIYILTALVILNLGYQAAFHSPGPFRLRYADAAAIVTQAHTDPERVLVLNGMDANALRYRLYPKGIRVTRLPNEQRLIAELDALGKYFAPRWIVLTSSEITDRVLAQCDESNRACTLSDLTASKHLAVVYVRPREAN